MRIRYNSWLSMYKKPFGALRREESCRIAIYIPRRRAALSASLILELDGKDEQRKISLDWSGLTEDGYDQYTTSFSLNSCGLYFYYFEIREPGKRYFLYRLNGTETVEEQGEKWQLTCFSENTPKETGMEGAVMYQIFPDRFYHDSLCDTTGKLTPFTIHDDRRDCPHYLPDQNGIVQNNDFFGGNLAGIQKKLPYLKELGVDILYLNPIFMAYSNHRYDTADYLRIDPLLGSEEDFISLCREAHAIGMRIILDGVFSHTGSNSVYFGKQGSHPLGAYCNPDSPYRKWYIFQEYPDKYTSWWGIDTLPCVREEEDSYMDFVILGEDSVIAHWLNCGADGFRLDVADELPDTFIAALYQRVKEIKQDGIVIGEVWEDASNKISYGKRRSYFTASTGLELDSVMNYPFRNAILGLITGTLSPAVFEQEIMNIAEHYPTPVLHSLMNSLSTHDTPRILTLTGNYPSDLKKGERANYRMSEEDFQHALKRAKAAVFLQFTLPGVPCIYYGDEAGMEGFEDPFNRRYYTWEQMNQDLLAFYKEMTALHRKLPAQAEIRFCQKKSDSCVVYSRGAFTAVLNVSGKMQKLEDIGKPIYLSCGEAEKNSLILEPFGFALTN